MHISAAPGSIDRTHLSQVPCAARALASMAVPAIMTDAGGIVTAANASAVRCFRLEHPCGRALAEVLAEWEGADRLLCAASDESDPVPVRLTNGPRVIEGVCRQMSLSDAPHASCTDPASSDPAFGHVLTFSDVSVHARALEDAQRDALTGLLNRTALRGHLAAAVAAGRGGALLCIDLDRFKMVNDTLGHPVGDALLLKIAERLRRATRADDLVARLGGDEFAVIQAPGTGAQADDQAEVLALRLTDLLGRTYVLNGHMVNVGASVGVAKVGLHGADADELLRNADLALYQAKSDGRGIFRTFEPAMDHRLQARRLLELELRRALAFKEFELAYQPQVRATDREVVGFEALLRWRNAGRGLVSPAHFIPLAEEIGLMPAIGEWVLRTACKEAASWPKPVMVAVNLSPVQFRNPKLTAVVVSALRESGLPPERLELEITEGALLENTDAVVGILGELSAMGVQTSMDDFGTGYSSLSYLQKFRFDRIKIDQSFVQQVGVNADSTAIVRAVAALGASLGMKTTAEGVETDAQLAHIQAQGCTEIQGYLTGRPMTGADASTLLRGTVTPPPPALPAQPG